MGWSHRAEAGRTLQAWEDFCYGQTGLTNVYTIDDSRYMFETDPITQRDGSIVGQCWRYITVSGKAGTVVNAGRFKIAGDGTVPRYPPKLKRLLERVGVA